MTRLVFGNGTGRGIGKHALALVAALACAFPAQAQFSDSYNVLKAVRERDRVTVSEMVNSPGSGFGGAITAALFLENFVADTVAWAHFDLMAWNQKSRPGRPEGGEAMALRACFSYLNARFGSG